MQALAAGGACGEIPLVVVIGAAGQAAGAGLVDVFPGGIDGQLIRNTFAPITFFQVVHGLRGFLVVGFLIGRFGLFAGAGAFCTIGHRVRIVEIIAIFLAFEHRVGLQGLLDLLLQIQGRQLEQADGLLQLRRHRQLLAHSQD